MKVLKTADVTITNEIIINHVGENADDYDDGYMTSDYYGSFNTSYVYVRTYQNGDITLNGELVHSTDLIIGKLFIPRVSRVDVGILSSVMPGIRIVIECYSEKAGGDIPVVDIVAV